VRPKFCAVCGSNDDLLGFARYRGAKTVHAREMVGGHAGLNGTEARAIARRARATIAKLAE
jgi:hypothetical protein